MANIATKTSIRFLAGGNVILLLTLTFYISHLLMLEYLKLEPNQEPSLCWFTWVMSAGTFFILVSLQITVDCFLFASNSDGAGLTETCKTWQKISTLFLTFLTLGLLLSLLCDQMIANAELTLVLVLGEMSGRLLTMVFVQKYLAEIGSETSLRTETNHSIDSTSNSTDLDPYIRYISTSKMIHDLESQT